MSGRSVDLPARIAFDTSPPTVSRNASAFLRRAVVAMARPFVVAGMMRRHLFRDETPYLPAVGDEAPETTLGAFRQSDARAARLRIARRVRISRGASQHARDSMSCKCCRTVETPETRRAKERERRELQMHNGPAFHLAPPPKPPPPRRLENSWQHEWDASDRPPLYEAPKPDAFRPPPPAPRLPPAVAARMAGLESPPMKAPFDGEIEEKEESGAADSGEAADSAEAVRAALGLSPRGDDTAGRVDTNTAPSTTSSTTSKGKLSNLSKMKKAISMRRAFAPVARNASEWQASLVDPEKEAQERQIGDLMASLGINKHKKKRRNLVYPEAVATDGDRDSSPAPSLPNTFREANIKSQQQTNAAGGFERSGRVDVVTASARATAFGPAMSPTVHEARAADYPDAGTWGLKAELATHSELSSGEAGAFAVAPEYWTGRGGAGLGSLRQPAPAHGGGMNSLRR